MSNVDLPERKQALEVEIKDLQSKKESLVQSMSTIQRQVVELEKLQYQLDGKYQLVCEVMGLDAKEEWGKTKAVSEKAVPTESAEEKC